MKNYVKNDCDLNKNMIMYWSKCIWKTTTLKESSLINILLSHNKLVMDVLRVLQTNCNH